MVAKRGERGFGPPWRFVEAPDLGDKDESCDYRTDIEKPTTLLVVSLMTGAVDAFLIHENLGISNSVTFLLHGIVAIALFWQG